MNGGALKADSLLSSNNPPGAVNSTLTLNAGTIETYRGSVVVQTNASTFSWGTATGGSMNWTMLGGTNLLDGGQAAGTYFQNGTIAVSGSGTVWTNARTLYLGRGGSALGTRLVVSNGATAFNTTTYLNENCTNVSVLVADKGAWYVGQLRFANASTASNTELVISNGGAVYSIGVGELSLGYSGGGTRMVVTGKDSIYSNTIAGGVVQFGKDGGGNTLSVLDGGTFSTLQHFDVGYAAASTGNVLTVSGSNSLLQIAGNFFQRLGGGAVTVSNGGALVVGGNFSLGTNGTAGTVGGGSGLSALVADGGVLQANTILMGYGGTGILTNFGGIFRFTTGSPTITMNTPGMIVVTNGMVEFAGVTNAALAGEITKFTYQGTNTLALNSATNTIVANYTVQGGSNFSTLDLKGAGSLFRSTNTFSIGIGGSLVGAGAIQSLVVSNAGTIAPGHSPGTLTFSSNLTLLDSSVLVMEINSTNAGDYDRLVVGGAMMRAGTLMITNIGSWSFAVSNRFDLFDYASWSGGFSVTNLPTLDGGLKWDFTDFESQGVLTVALALPIPEPSPFLAMGAGLALLAVLRRRA
jgi:T5SS/PEP-CTERM-associated repeat protein